jgi:hypothetical protein
MNWEWKGGGGWEGGCDYVTGGLVDRVRKWSGVMGIML